MKCRRRPSNEQEIVRLVYPAGLDVSHSLLLLFPIIAILAGILLPALSFLRGTDAIILFTALWEQELWEVYCFSLRDCRITANADFGLLVQAHRQTFTANFMLPGIVWLRVK